ncbi:hypothetical protein CRG98_046353 [Punica granatum]|uniref:Uncharacterized protein n=1 Tax=Punica granatum TaxID=22663 RepID=A0A2I0HNF8_PUNGR|nr:hypothetical protein CRG98_046353 [Punica granatum]
MQGSTAMSQGRGLNVSDPYRSRDVAELARSRKRQSPTSVLFDPWLPRFEYVPSYLLTSPCMSWSQPVAVQS